MRSFSSRLSSYFHIYCICYFFTKRKHASWRTSGSHYQQCKLSVCFTQRHCRTNTNCNKWAIHQRRGVGGRGRGGGKRGSGIYFSQGTLLIENKYFKQALVFLVWLIMANHVTGWLAGWLAGWLIDVLSDLLTYWLMVDWPAGWLTQQLTPLCCTVYCQRNCILLSN